VTSLALTTLLVGAAALAGGCDASAPADVPTERVAVPAAAPRVAEARAASSASPSLAFVERVTKSGKHAFVCFHRGTAQLLEPSCTAFRSSMAQVSGRAEGMAVDVTDPAESAVVKRYDLGRTPLPAVLVFAPNGALVRGLVDFDEKALLGAFATPAMAASIKFLADGRMVVLAVRGTSADANEAAGRAAQELVADAAYAGHADVVAVDPALPEDAAWLAGFGVDATHGETVTVLVKPPGMIAAALVGATTKEKLVEALRPKAPS
jgi:hypothetical protein